MKNFGTLDIIRNKENLEVYKVTGFQPTVFLSRLVPNSWADERNSVEIDTNIQNTRYIMMILSVYPLEIKKPELWISKLADVKNNDDLAETLQTLNVVEPNSKKFTGTLRDFQKLSLDFLNKTNGNALIADEMGLGKTVEALAYIASKENSMPVLVVSPLVTLQNWENEIKRFIKTEIPGTLIENDFTEPRTLKIRSGKSDSLPPVEFYIINYELLSKRKDDLARIGIKTIIFDEVQNLRRMSTGKFQAARELAMVPSVRNRIALSGTPIYNKGLEIWGMIDILQHGLLGSYDDFVKTFGNYWGDKVEASRQKALSEILRDHVMLRRYKHNVASELPEKNRFKQVIEINEEVYTREIEKMFERINQAKIALNNATNEDDKKNKIFELTASYNSGVQNERKACGIAKAPYVIEYIRDLMELEEKIVVFVHHLDVHSMLMNGLYDFNPLQIVGGQKDEFRYNEIDEFQNNPDRKLLIAGLRAGSMGINLTAGSYVIFGELDWSPPIHRQAEDRLHRIGQIKPVFAHYLIGQGTMDEVLVRTLTDKALEIDTVLGDKKEKWDNEKSREILESIYSKLGSKKSTITKEVMNQ